MNALFDLTGKTAVVTGGTGALGSALCRGLAAAGASIVVIARTAETVDAAAEKLTMFQSAGAIGIAADVLDRDSLESALGRAIERFGGVDILVNAAGGNVPAATTAPDRPFWDLPSDALRGVVDLNLLGTMLPCQAFGRHFAERGSGVIVNLTSMAALTPLTRVVGYAAAKAALSNFTQWLAVYMAREHSSAIRVNAIAPGFFLGDQNRYLLMDESGGLTTRGRQILDHTPMGRFGEPDDLIGAAVWLASDAARFVTGVVIPVDGGFGAYSGV